LKIIKNKAQSFKDLQVWQKAFNLLLKVYKATKDYPQEEKYGMVLPFGISHVNYDTFWFQKNGNCPLPLWVSKNKNCIPTSEEVFLFFNEHLNFVNNNIKKILL